MHRSIATAVALALLTPTLPLAGALTSDDDAFWAQRDRELRALLEGPAPEDPVAALLGVAFAPDAPQENVLVAARAVHALDARMTEEQAIALATGAIGLRLQRDVAGAFRDPVAVLAARDAGTLDRATLDAIGLDAPALVERARLLSALGAPDEAQLLALAERLDEPATTWEQGTWDTYGLTVELALLALATQSSELAAWILPHDFRIITTAIQMGTVGPVSEGDVNNGRIWTQVYADALVGLAMDNHGNADAILLQIPITAYAEVNWRCTTTFFGVCVGWSFGSVAGPGDTLVATDATYTFAYPANGGEFPTRATGQDLLQSAYDRLGMLPRGSPTDYAYRSQVAGTPGIADLSTQAPRVTYYGLQVSAELAPIRDVVRHVRVHEPAPLSLDAAGQGAVDVGPYNIGPTAGYHATEVRGYEITMLIVRWHNVGVGSTGVLPSSPATFYYDVPAGAYKPTGSRVDAYDGVVVEDWALAGDLPQVPAIPTI